MVQEEKRLILPLALTVLIQIITAPDIGFGRPFTNDTTVSQALKFVRRIDPGDTVNGLIMLFDVAPGRRAVNIELHDSPLSQGVRVRLYSAREAGPI